jgi:hypothetical protein
MLLFSRDEAFIQHFHSAFPNAEAIWRIDDFDHRMESTRVDAVVVDCDDHADGLTALKKVRNSKANAATICIAVINGQTAASDAQDMGAWQVVPKSGAWKSLKPLQDWVRTVRRREHYRFPLDDPALIDSGGLIGRQIKMLNISMGGASFTTQGVDELEHRIVLRLSAGRFPCEVVWRESAGRVGVRFVEGRFSRLDLDRVLGRGVL